MQRFTDKTVLVTGGNSGIGLAAALRFAAEGARVVITGRDAASLDAARARLGPGAIALVNDAGQMAGNRALGAALAEAGLRLDAVFINAGIVRMGPLAEITEVMWDESFAINTKGAFFTIQAIAPLLNDGAGIVLMGSVNAHIGMPGSSVYAASKGALITLAKTLSGELVGRGIRVNVVSPGPIDTPLYGKLGVADEGRRALAAQVPLKRFGTADEVAGAVLYLASAEAGYVVGTELLIDGGMSEL